LLLRLKFHAYLAVMGESRVPLPVRPYGRTRAEELPDKDEIVERMVRIIARPRFSERACLGCAGADRPSFFVLQVVDARLKATAVRFSF